MEKRPALGKGLSALIPDAALDAVSPLGVGAPVAASERRLGAVEVDIDLLSPNTLQPRAQMDDGRLAELAQSIRSNGVIQPIIVRRSGERFQIIAGERRWRAARQAGLSHVPVVVRDVPDGREGSVLEMALIENIQRENLNPIDEALAYKRLADEFHLTQDAIAAAVGKDRATVANFMRLLRLPDDVRADVAAGTLSMGHARALLALTAESELRRAAREVVARGLSVRETESLVRRAAEHLPGPQPAPSPPADVHTRAAEEKLRMRLGTRVRIVRKRKGGRIEIDYGSEDELIRVYDLIMEAD
jgi:ParB family chromosome partitioning protein